MKKEFTERDLHNSIRSLYLNKPFYGYVLNKVRRRLETTIPYAACVLPAKLLLVVNPVMFKDFTELERKVVLEHEVLHLALLHYERFKIIEKDIDMVQRDIFNISADCAINQYIDNLPEDTITLEYVRELASDVKLKEKQNWEYYYKALMKSKKIKKALKEQKKLRELLDKINEQFQRSYKDMDSQAKNKMKRLLSKAKKIQKKFNREHGVNPGDSFVDILPDYDGVVHKSIWEKLIDKSVGEEITAEKYYCFGRPSRRVDGSFYYTRKEQISSSVYIGIDTSGSISDKDLEMFLGYIEKGMKKFNTDVILIAADTQVNEVYRYRSGAKLKNVKLTGRGGTDMRVKIGRASCRERV